MTGPQASTLHPLQLSWRPLNQYQPESVNQNHQDAQLALGNLPSGKHLAIMIGPAISMAQNNPLFHMHDGQSNPYDCIKDTILQLY